MTAGLKIVPPAAAERFLSYGRQLVDEADIAAVVSVLRGDYITQGPLVERFEAALAEYVGARYCVAVSSGTAGLHIACLAAGLAPGMAGVTTPLTFVASANAIRYCGAKVELADIDRAGLGLSSSGLIAALARRPEAAVVIPVHFAGLASGIEEVRNASEGRPVIEDACHALGGRYVDGRAVGCGAYSDMTVFSFHPVKPITTGEGGAVLTNEPELAHRLRLLRSHGIERAADRFEHPSDASESGRPYPWYYEQQMLGFNYRLSDMQAALGLSQLTKLDGFRLRRLEIARRYDDAFGEVAHLAIPQSGPAERSRSALHLYTILVDFAALATTRAAFMACLHQQGVGSQVHYVPVYRQPYHQALLAGDSSLFPAAEAHYQSCLSLPLHAGLSDAEVERVIDAVRDGACAS